MTSARRLALVLVLLSGGLPLAAGTDSYHLQIGDPARRDREVPVVLDVIVDTHSGEEITPRDLAERLAGTRLVFVGESHTNHEYHRVQLQVLRELARAGREVLIGLEMYPYTEQQYLDGWVAGDYTEEGFVAASHWYEAWGYHWNYYREIFQLARTEGMRMFAINAPRDVVRKVRVEGFDQLTEEEARHIPPEIDTTSEEHRTLFKSYFDEDDPIHSSMSEEAWEGMINAQATWDATMGFNAVNALAAHGGPDSVMVVLIGSGHVAYGLGIERQARKWSDGGMASIIPVPMEDEDGEPIESVQASFADAVWGVAEVEAPLYPVLGVSTTKIPDDAHRRVIDVAEDSVGESAGFEVGDVLLVFDGEDLVTREVFTRAMADKRWGDDAVITVRRGEETLDLDVHFRRSDDDGEEEKEE